MASDKNLLDEPIDLYYATETSGPWLPIAKGLKNSGQYRWEVPHLNSPRVQDCVCTNRNATEPPDLPLCLALHSWNGETIPFEARLDHREPEVLMPLPLNFQRLKDKHVDLAREWRSATRCVYEAYFARGYAIVGYHIKRHEGDRYGYYRIARDWRESLDI